NITIDLEHILLFQHNVRENIGFIIAERIDFGTAKSINSVYNDLLGFTPFSKKDICKFNELLSMRNLLVHHGGVYTLGYNKQHFHIKNLGRMFFDSLVIKTQDFMMCVDFVEQMVDKICDQSFKALNTYF